MGNMKKIKLNDFEIGGEKLTILAGPCAIENIEILDKTAAKLKEITKRLDINFVFKSSFDKGIFVSVSNVTLCVHIGGQAWKKGLRCSLKSKKGTMYQL